MTYTKYYHYLQTYSEFSLWEQASFIKIFLLGEQERSPEMECDTLGKGELHSINTRMSIHLAQPQDSHCAKRIRNFLTQLVFMLARNILKHSQQTGSLKRQKICTCVSVYIENKVFFFFTCKLALLTLLFSSSDDLFIISILL